MKVKELKELLKLCDDEKEIGICIEHDVDIINHNIDYIIIDDNEYELCSEETMHTLVNREIRTCNNFIDNYKKRLKILLGSRSKNKNDIQVFIKIVRKYQKKIKYLKKYKKGEILCL